MTVEEALKILREYSCTQIKIPASEAEKQQLQQGVILITKLSEWENLGVCADNSSQGFAVLKSYLKAMGYEANFDSASISTSNDSVYIKYNTQKRSYLIDSYVGEYRGVLISCQSEDDRVMGTYGHLPLDLFA